jgi:D-glycero-D-manno-heptose 1,7-bisphosphate phosphatase
LSKAAVFLDRDDTIIKDKSYLGDPDEIEILKGAAEAIRLLNSRNIPVIVITNQSGIARGIFDEERLRIIHERLRALLGEQGAKVDAIYYCPHLPGGIVKQYAIACTCRKPDTGMLLKAAHDFGLDLASCFMVGDKPEDIEVIHKVGGKGIFMQTGKHRNTGYRADFIAHDLLQAAQWILSTMRE